MSKENVELVRSLIPPPDADIVALFRDEASFEARREALEALFDPDFEAVAVWQGGATYHGADGLRQTFANLGLVSKTESSPS
jgi:hypothetical protein